VRLPDPLPAAARLPAGAGIVARGAGPAVLLSLARLARWKRRPLLLGGDPRGALRLHAGLHLPDRDPGLALLPFLAARRAGVPFALLTLAVHGGLAAMGRARRLRPDLVLLSPVFPTPSHPGAPALGPIRWALTARRLVNPVAALGGIRAGNAGRIPRFCAGFAAIGALS